MGFALISFIIKMTANHLRNIYLIKIVVRDINVYYNDTCRENQLKDM